MLRIDFGCGDNLKKGFEGVDIRPLKGVKHQCAAWDIPSKIKPGSVDEIYCSHLLQYLTLPQVHTTLQSWHHILKEGGVAQIIVPDFTYWARRLVDENPSDPGVVDPNIPIMQEAIWNLWGRQRYGFEETWDVAKSGFTFPLLSGMLRKNNFKTVFRVNEDKPWEMNILTQKRGAQQEKECAEHLYALERQKSKANS